MTIRYTLADPTKNYTVLVDTPVPVHLQPDAAAAVMRSEPLAEQAGFLSEMTNTSVRLRMAGGEFCGNASMSAAAVCAAASGRTDTVVTVHVEEVDTDVRVHIRQLPDGGYAGTVEMPRPLSVRQVTLPEAGMVPVVSFRGISHVIVTKALAKKKAETLAPVWCSALSAQAVGIMQFDRAQNRLTPLVYVPAADTLFWENSCASGTSAVGYWLSAQTLAPCRAAIIQPGGTLEITTFADGSLRLTGTVALLKEGQILYRTSSENSRQ